jgi:isopenicillin N synthase-like dioxygenase
MLVPVIDISPFVSESSSSKAARDAVVAQVADACRYVGFLVITNHGVAPKTIADAFEAAKEYFDQPSGVKKAVSMTPEYPYGYESAEILSKSKDAADKTVLPDLKETFQVCVGPEGREPHVPAQWPEGPQGFKDAMAGYYRSVEKLAAVMMQIFAHALELPGDYFDKKIDNHMSSLRIL